MIKHYPSYACSSSLPYPKSNQILWLSHIRPGSSCSIVLFDTHLNSDIQPLKKLCGLGLDSVYKVSGKASQFMEIYKHILSLTLFFFIRTGIHSLSFQKRTIESIFSFSKKSFQEALKRSSLMVFHHVLAD